MCRKTLLILCTGLVMLLGLVSPASVYAKNFGPSIKIPNGIEPQLGFNGNFTVKVAGGGLRLSATCNCFGGGGGKCEVELIATANDRNLVCRKAKAGQSCAGHCSFTTTTTTTGFGSE